MVFIRLLIAFILPPLAVYMQFGASRQLALNMLLTLLGFVPGMVHAVFIMASEPPGLVRRERFDEQLPPYHQIVKHYGRSIANP